MANKLLKSLKNFKIKFVSVVDSGDNPEAEVVMFKEKGGVVMKKLEEIMAELSKEDQSVVQAELDKIPDIETANGELKGQVETLEKEKGELTEKVEELKKVKPVVDTSDEELIKSADPKIQEMLEKAKEVEDENAKLKKEKEDGEAELRKAELTKEAEEYPNLGAPVEDIVEIFSAVEDNEKVTGLVKGILGAVNTALEGTELLKAVGNNKDPVVKSTEEELQEKAEAMVKEKGITIEAAKTEIMKTDLDKYMI